MNRIVLLSIEWLLLAAALAAFTITETYAGYVSLGLLLLAGAFSLRIIRTHHLAPLTGLEAPGLLFIVSAAVAAWAAYDQPTALLQFARILAAAVLYYAVIDSTLQPDKPRRSYTVVRLTAFVFVLAAAGLALYWPLLHDFSAEPSKFSFVNEAIQRVKSLLPALPGPFIHSNVAGGALAAAAPIAVFLAWEFWRLRKRWLGLLVAGVSLVILAGLVVTGSRGGLLGLAAAAGLATLGVIQRRWFKEPRRKAIFWGVGTAGILVLAGVLIASGSLEGLLGQIPDPTGSLQSRPRLWSQGLPLAQDYFFTGSGLMSFFYTYPAYALLTVVPVYYHIHNLLLEVMLEQGFFGVIAMLWAAVVILVWAWKALDYRLQEPVSIQTTQHPFDDGVPSYQDPNAQLLRPLTNTTVLGWAGLLAIVVVTVHGLVDTVFYVWRLLPVLGLISGLAYLAVPLEKLRRDRQRAVLRGGLIALAVIGLLGVVSVLAIPRVQSAWYANLGSIYQAQAELGPYSKTSFQKNTLDEVRRTVDLQPAIAQFERALKADPGNITSLRRLTDLYLSLGQYEQALQTIQAAWEAGHRDRMTRLLLADSLVAAGQVEAASAHLAELPSQLTSLAEGRLMYQAWYRYTVNRDFQRAANAWQAVLNLNPDNSQAQNGLEEAKRNLQ